MKSRLLPAVAVLLFLAAPAPAAKLTVKVEDAPPPTEVATSVRGLLDAKALSVYDGDKLLCTVWPRKEFESKTATADQAKNGLTYSELDESTVVGAVKLPAVWTDFRKQKIKAGVYTLRLGWQPMDGDHMGTAPFNEFCLLAAADKDTKPDLMEAKDLHELSAKSTARKHPSIMLLFPNRKPAESPAVEARPKDHWVLSYRVGAAAGGEKAFL